MILLIRAYPVTSLIVAVAVVAFWAAVVGR